MTTFDDFESSPESSEPVEVYTFAIGSQVFRFTSGEDTITLDSDDFAPTSIARSAIAVGEDARRRILTVTVPADNEVARLYVGPPPGQKATVTIVRLQRSEVPTFDTRVLVYKGSILSVQFPDGGETAKIAVQSFESATSRVIPQYGYGAMCNHMLYGPGCEVDPSNHNHVGMVSFAGGNQIILDGAGASGHDLVGGFCKPTTQSDFRLILAQAGDLLTLLIPFPESVVGQNVQAFAGCNKIVDGDCALVFDNVARFGGFAFVPRKNIYATGL